MFIASKQKKFIGCFRAVMAVIITAFVSTSLVPGQRAFAQGFDLPLPGTMVKMTSQFMPAVIKGLKVDPQNPLLFEFLIDPGQVPLDPVEKKIEYHKLIKYFLASLTTPEKDMWVNLSPYEHSRIISHNFGSTEMGRDMLAQDYILKQLAASLVYPENGLGKKFWDKVYERVRMETGGVDIPVSTFNKVWIIPQSATIFEKGNVAMITDSHLKVMMEEDYLSLDKHGNAPKMGLGNLSNASNSVHKTSSEVMREIIIPAIEKEVNEGKNFAQLRQMYNSMVLASWFKQRLRMHLLSRIYVNKNEDKGVELQNPQENEQIYKRYLQAYKKGVYNYIKEESDPVSGEIIPRKYFSGGIVNNLEEKGIGKPGAVMQEAKGFPEAAMMAPLDNAMTTLDLNNPQVAASRVTSFEMREKEIVELLNSNDRQKIITYINNVEGDGASILARWIARWGLANRSVESKLRWSQELVGNLMEREEISTFLSTLHSEMEVEAREIAIQLATEGVTADNENVINKKLLGFGTDVNQIQTYLNGRNEQIHEQREALLSEFKAYRSEISLVLQYVQERLSTEQPGEIRGRLVQYEQNLKGYLDKVAGMESKIGLWPSSNLVDLRGEFIRPVMLLVNEGDDIQSLEEGYQGKLLSEVSIFRNDISNTQEDLKAWFDFLAGIKGERADEVRSALAHYQSGLDISSQEIDVLESQIGSVLGNFDQRKGQLAEIRASLIRERNRIEALLENFKLEIADAENQLKKQQLLARLELIRTNFIANLLRFSNLGLLPQIIPVVQEPAAEASSNVSEVVASAVVGLDFHRPLEAQTPRARAAQFQLGPFLSNLPSLPVLNNPVAPLLLMDRSPVEHEVTTDVDTAAPALSESGSTLTVATDELERAVEPIVSEEVVASPEEIVAPAGNSFTRFIGRLSDRLPFIMRFFRFLGIAARKPVAASTPTTQDLAVPALQSSQVPDFMAWQRWQRSLQGFFPTAQPRVLALNPIQQESAVVQEGVSDAVAGIDFLNPVQDARTLLFHLGPFIADSLPVVVFNNGNGAVVPVFHPSESVLQVLENGWELLPQEAHALVNDRLDLDSQIKQLMKDLKKIRNFDDRKKILIQISRLQVLRANQRVNVSTGKRPPVVMVPRKVEQSPEQVQLEGDIQLAQVRLSEANREIRDAQVRASQGLSIEDARFQYNTIDSFFRDLRETLVRMQNLMASQKGLLEPLLLTNGEEKPSKARNLSEIKQLILQARKELDGKTPEQQLPIRLLIAKLQIEKAEVELRKAKRERAKRPIRERISDLNAEVQAIEDEIAGLNEIVAVVAPVSVPEAAEIKPNENKAREMKELERQIGQAQGRVRNAELDLAVNLERLKPWQDAKTIQKEGQREIDAAKRDLQKLEDRLRGNPGPQAVSRNRTKSTLILLASVVTGLLGLLFSIKALLPANAPAPAKELPKPAPSIEVSAVPVAPVPAPEIPMKPAPIQAASALAASIPAATPAPVPLKAAPLSAVDTMTNILKEKHLFIMSIAEQDYGLLKAIASKVGGELVFTGTSIGKSENSHIATLDAVAKDLEALSKQLEELKKNKIPGVDKLQEAIGMINDNIKAIRDVENLEGKVTIEKDEKLSAFLDGMEEGRAENERIPSAAKQAPAASTSQAQEEPNYSLSGVHDLLFPKKGESVITIFDDQGNRRDLRNLDKVFTGFGYTFFERGNSKGVHSETTTFYVTTSDGKIYKVEKGGRQDITTVGIPESVASASPRSIAGILAPTGESNQYPEEAPAPNPLLNPFITPVPLQGIPELLSNKDAVFRTVDYQILPHAKIVNYSEKKNKNGEVEGIVWGISSGNAVLSKIARNIVPKPFTDFYIEVPFGNDLTLEAEVKNGKVTMFRTLSIKIPALSRNGFEKREFSYEASGERQPMPKGSKKIGAVLQSSIWNGSRELYNDDLAGNPEQLGSVAFIRGNDGTMTFKDFYDVGGFDWDSEKLGPKTDQNGDLIPRMGTDGKKMFDIHVMSPERIPSSGLVTKEINIVWTPQMEKNLFAHADSVPKYMIQDGKIMVTSQWEVYDVVANEPFIRLVDKKGNLLIIDVGDADKNVVRKQFLFASPEHPVVIANLGKKRDAKFVFVELEADKNGKLAYVKQSASELMAVMPPASDLKGLFSVPPGNLMEDFKFLSGTKTELTPERLNDQVSQALRRFHQEKIDAAAVSSLDKNGGIDFDPKYLQLNMQGNAINMPIPKGFQWLLNTPIGGFSPNILKIRSGMGFELSFFKGLMTSQEERAAKEKVLMRFAACFMDHKYMMKQFTSAAVV